MNFDHFDQNMINDDQSTLLQKNKTTSLRRWYCAFKLRSRQTLNILFSL